MAPNTPSSSPVIPFSETGALILDCDDGKRLAIGRTYLASLSTADAEKYIASKAGNAMIGRKLPRTEGAFRLSPRGKLEWIQVDFNGFNELLRYMHGLRVLQSQQSASNDDGWPDYD